jgi:ketosteroid isomerase-like protein
MNWPHIAERRGIARPRQPGYVITNHVNEHREVRMTDDDTIREANRQTLGRAMAAIGALDVDAVLAELHEDVLLQLPYEDQVPDLDKTGFGELFKVMFTLYKQFDITLTDVFDLVDPNQVIARYNGDCVGSDKDVRYANRYIGVFRFADGKITLWCEYDNPVTTLKALDDFAAE